MCQMSVVERVTITCVARCTKARNRSFLHDDQGCEVDFVPRGNCVIVTVCVAHRTPDIPSIIEVARVARQIVDIDLQIVPRLVTQPDLLTVVVTNSTALRCSTIQSMPFMRWGLPSSVGLSSNAIADLPPV